MSNDRQLVGNTGVYHVARELSRHGWNVLLTVRNARGADLYAVSSCETIAHPIQIKAHSGKPNDVRLGLTPEALVTPWWVFVAHALSVVPTCYVVSSNEMRERMTRDPGTRSGKPEHERACWFDRRYFTPGSDRELIDAREAWHRLGGIGSQLSDDGNPTFNLDDPLLKIATHVKVAERSSKREIKRLFTYLREENGWDVKTVPKPEKHKKDKKFAEAVKGVNEKRILALLGARDIDDEEYKRLRKLLRAEKKITKDDRYAMEKYRMAKSYGRPVDRDLIERDKRGKLRDQCQVYRSIFHGGTFTKLASPQIRDDLNAGKPIKENPLWWVVGTIMIAVGLIENGKLNRKAVVRSYQLGSFVTLCVNNRVLIEGKFGKPLRKDLEENL